GQKFDVNCLHVSLLGEYTTSKANPQAIFTIIELHFRRISRIITPTASLAFNGGSRMRNGLAALAFLISSSLSFAGTSNSLMDVAPNGKSLIVANNDSGTVTLVDLIGQKAVREIKVGAKPEGVTWIGAGPLAAVTLYHDKQIVIFNTETGKVEKTIAVAAEPYGIVADAAGKRAWGSHEYPGVVSEVDLDAGAVLREIPAGPMVRGIALAPDGKRIYVSEFYTGVLNAIDLASGKIV